MNTPSPEPKKSRPRVSSDSWNCVDIVLDGQGDNTVHPSLPAQISELQAERDKILRYLGNLKGPMPEPIDIEIE